ncbi:MAG: ABC transporter permease [Elusimicrobia bacterium]|nr:ABC transporter permease [Elusimicrobiota bacterium]
MRSLKVLLGNELRALAAAPPFWLLLLCVSFLSGYSFIAAARLFGEASRSASSSPELARGLSPLDGILVPTLGGLYLATTLLYPFLAIRFISSEKESGSLKLLLQLPVPLEASLAAKVLALSLGWLAALGLPLSSFLLWNAKGGHVGGGELANLLLGHSLYAFAITGVAMLCAALADSTAAAALLCLAFVLGNWAVDFAASTEAGWVRRAGAFSMTSCLHQFEKGLFSSAQGSFLVITALACLAGTAVWLKTGDAFAVKTRRSALVLMAGALAALLSLRLPFYRDASEDKRNSFSAGDDAALSRLPRLLQVTVNLSPEDSRLWDLERSVLSKLKRAVPKISVRLQDASATALGGGDDRYGLIVFDYGGRSEQTRSTSEEEILPIIYSLAREKAPSAKPWDYPGHPLVADFSGARVWFYGVIPILLAAAWRLSRRRTN